MIIPFVDINKYINLYLYNLSEKPLVYRENYILVHTIALLLGTTRALTLAQKYFFVDFKKNDQKYIFKEFVSLYIISLILVQNF